jgi:hypothetical protein
MASILRGIVVAALLAAWSFPAAAATTAQSQPAPIVEKTQIARSADTDTEAAQYGAREQQAPANQSFQGGGVSIYIGGGVLTAALLILLIVILI